MCDKFPEFKERLNLLLSESDQTIVAFAKTLGTSRQSLGYYLNGDRIPDASMIKQICERCNVSSDWLLGLSDIKKPDANCHSIWAYTGLSETVIEKLHRSKDISQILNCFLIETSHAAEIINLIDMMFGYDASFVLESEPDEMLRTQHLKGVQLSSYCAYEATKHFSEFLQLISDTFTAIVGDYFFPECLKDESLKEYKVAQQGEFYEQVKSYAMARFGAAIKDLKTEFFNDPDIKTALEEKNATETQRKP